MFELPPTLAAKEAATYRIFSFYSSKKSKGTGRLLLSTSLSILLAVLVQFLSRHYKGRSILLDRLLDYTILPVPLHPPVPYIHKNIAVCSHLF